MNKIKIGIDIDGVLLDLMSSFLEWYNLNHNTTYTLEDIFDYYLPSVFNVDSDSFREEIELFYNSPFFDSIEPMQGAQRAISYLNTFSNLYVITARPLTWKEKTIKSLNKYFGDVFEDIVFTASSVGEEDKRERRIGIKSNIIEKLSLDYFIEDNIEYVVGLNNITDILLYTQPWNRGYKIEDNNVRRVKNWQEIIEVIGRFGDY